MLNKRSDVRPFRKTRKSGQSSGYGLLSKGPLGRSRAHSSPTCQRDVRQPPLGNVGTQGGDRKNRPVRGDILETGVWPSRTSRLLGLGGGIRTHDLSVPNRALLPG